MDEKRSSKTTEKLSEKHEKWLCHVNLFMYNTLIRSFYCFSFFFICFWFELSNWIENHQHHRTDFKFSSIYVSGYTIIKPNERTKIKMRNENIEKFVETRNHLSNHSNRCKNWKKKYWQKTKSFFMWKIMSKAIV